MVKPGKILVIEDSPVLRSTVVSVLKNAGYQVLASENGFEAIEFFLLYRKELRVMFIDVHMPKMGGLEFLELLSDLEYEEMQHIKRVIMTIEKERDLIVKAKSLGVSGWLLKPVKAKYIISITESFMK